MFTLFAPRNVLCIIIIFVLLTKRGGGQLRARLVNEKRWQYWAGRLEILFNETWSTVCHHGFGNTEAQVACRMLGFDRPQAFPVSSLVFGSDQDTILPDKLACQGTEASMSQCSHSQFYIHDCQHSEDIGVFCNIPSSHLGLAGARRTTLDAGGVEIKLDYQWNMLCGDFSSRTAKTICRLLGFSSSEAATTAASSFGPLRGHYIDASLRCVGDETDITGCFQSIGRHMDDCSSQSGVICTNKSRPLYIVAAR